MVMPPCLQFHSSRQAILDADQESAGAFMRRLSPLGDLPVVRNFVSLTRAIGYQQTGQNRLKIMRILGIRHGKTVRASHQARVAALLLLVGAATAFAQSGGPPGGSVESLLNWARLQNPEFTTARYEAQAAAERVYPAGAFPDPVLQRELEIDNFSDQTTTTGHSGSQAERGGGSYKFRFVQAVPFWGKRELRREVAAAESEQAKGRVDSTWNELAAKIKSAYAQYYVVARTETLTREILDILVHLEQTAQARYLSGLTPQQDSILAQAEQTVTRTELVNIETERRNWQYRINALLKRPPSSPLAEPGHLRPIPAAEKLTYDALEQRLEAKNPQLFVDDAGITAAEKGRELTYRNRWPDGGLGFTIIQTTRKPIANSNEYVLPGVFLELEIPLQQPRRRSQEREAEAKLAAAKERKAATENQLLADLAQSLAALDGSMRTQRLLETSLVPQTELSFKSAQASYETGRMAFGILLDAQRQIRKAKVDLLKSEAETQVRLADIERLVGEDL